MKSVQFFSPEILLERLRLAREGDRAAANDVVQTMQPLVLRVHHALGRPVSAESIQAGLIAIFKAIQRYDFRHDHKFTTYAYFAVRNALRSFFRPFVNRQTLCTCKNAVRSEAALDSHVLSHRRQSKPNRTIDLMPYISKLPQERLRLILVLRFGLGEDPKPMSLAETGKRVGLSKQRVHQLETQALTMLRKVLTRAPEEVVEEIEEICHRRVVR